MSWSSMYRTIFWRKSYKITETINNPQGIGFKMEHRILMAGPDNPDYYCEGAVAGKTGYTSIAGNTLVTYAAREGQNLVSVILNFPVLSAVCKSSSLT